MARIEGWETFARIVFVGPVLKKRQKQVKDRYTQIQVNDYCKTAHARGNPTSMAVPETRK